MDHYTNKLDQLQVDSEPEKYPAVNDLVQRIQSGELTRCACCAEWVEPHNIQNVLGFEQDDGTVTPLVVCLFCAFFANLNEINLHVFTRRIAAYVGHTGSKVVQNA